MIKIKLNLENIKIIKLFENLTGAGVKDLINGTTLIFIINNGDLGKAIGKKGLNIKKIQNVLKKKIKLIEYNGNIKTFTNNVIMPLKLANFKFDTESKILTLEAVNSKTRGLLIGRNASNLREYESLIQRYFDIKELKVK